MNKKPIQRELFNPRKGFTLIELLVVIAIIALLMGILMPALQRARQHAQRIVCGSNMKQMTTAVSLFANDMDGKIPPLCELPDGTWEHVQTQNHWARWFMTPGTPDDTYWNLGLLWKHGYIEQGKVFYCPSKLAVFRYEDYSNPEFPSPVLGGTSGVRVPYTYNPICKSLEDRERVVKTMADFKAGKTLLLVDVLRPGGVAHINGWNIAQGDLSVRFVVDETVLEIMEDNGDFIDADYESWDLVMNKLRQK